jgi:hypothetical protein
MIEPEMMFLLGFMVFCVIGIVYCAIWKEKMPVVNLNQVIADLGYTREQFLESDEIADICYEEVKRQGVEARLGYAIRRDAHYRGVAYGLAAGAAVGGTLFLTNKIDHLEKELAGLKIKKS